MLLQIDTFYLFLVLLYFRLLRQFPQTVIDAFFDCCYGYFYPDYDYWRVVMEMNIVPKILDSEQPITEALGLKENGLIKLKIIEDMSSLANDGDKMSFINTFISIGFWFEVLLFLIGFNLYNKNQKMIIVFIPMLVLWLTCLASPVNGMYRYIYALFTTMPVYFACTFYNKDRNMY